MYIVMRCEEEMYHGNYQNKTTIIGIRNDDEEAIDLLKKASEVKHEGEKPISGRFNSKGRKRRFQSSFFCFRRIS